MISRKFVFFCFFAGSTSTFENDIGKNFFFKYTERSVQPTHTKPSKNQYPKKGKKEENKNKGKTSYFSAFWE